MSRPGSRMNGLALVGTGSFSLNAHQLLREHNFEVVAFVDEFHPGPFLGQEVFKAGQIPEQVRGRVQKWLVAISDPENARQARARLVDAGIDAERILDLGDDPGLQILDLMLTKFGQAACQGVLRSGITSLSHLEEEFLGQERRAVLSRLNPARRTVGLGYFGRGGGFRRNISMLIPLLEKKFNVLTISDELHGGVDEAPKHLYMGSEASRALTELDLALTAHVFACGAPSVPRVCFSHVIYDLNLTAEYQLARLNHHDTNYVFVSSRPALEGWKKRLQDYPVDSRVCLVPGGYLSLDRSIQFFDDCPAALDSIIYAPTLSLSDYPTRWPFSDLVTSVDAGPEILHALLDSFPDHRIIFRPHPADLRFFALKRGDPREGPFGQMLELCRSHERCFLDREPDYGSSYGRSALMVSDTSSTAFTFALATGRPVVFFCKDDDQLQENLGKDLQLVTDRREVGAVVGNVTELLEQVGAYLEDPEGRVEKLTRFRNRMIFNVGESAAYFMSHVECMMAGDRHPEWHDLNW